MNIRPVCVVISVALSGLVASCGSSTTAPTSTLTPIAVSPNNSASISQNNSATGCSLLATDAGGGFGFTIQFQWAPPSQADGIVGYEIYATNTSVPLPVLDAIVQTTTTNYTMTQCNSYVIDVHLQAWQWRVRAQNAQGQFTDWSPWATFQFSPCRLSDGTPCG